MTPLRNTNSFPVLFGKDLSVSLNAHDALKVKRKKLFEKTAYTFHSISKNNKLKDIIKSVGIIVVAPFLYLILTLKIWKAQASTFPQTVPNSIDKFARSENTLIENTISKLTNNYNIIDNRKVTPEHRQQVKTILSEALKLKKKHEKDYYIVTHAQNAKWFVVSQLIKILVQKYDHDNNPPPLFEFIRSSKLNPQKNLNTYKNEIASRTDNADHDPDIRTSFLSADVFFWSTVIDESALDYLMRNRSIYGSCNSDFAISKTCMGILMQYLPKNTNFEKIMYCAGNIQCLADKIDTLCGQLFVICVPKTGNAGLSEVGFLSHPYGKPCDCHQDPINVLMEMQKGNKKYCKTKFEFPQFRLLGHKITPSNGNKCFLLNTLTEQQKSDIYTEISKAVDAIG